MVAYYAKYVVNATGMLMTNYGHNRVELMFAIRNTVERSCTKIKNRNIIMCDDDDIFL